MSLPFILVAKSSHRPVRELILKEPRFLSARDGFSATYSLRSNRPLGTSSGSSGARAAERGGRNIPKVDAGLVRAHHAASSRSSFAMMSCSHARITVSGVHRYISACTGVFTRSCQSQSAPRMTFSCPSGCHDLAFDCSTARMEVGNP